LNLREEIIGGWRKLRKKESHNLYISANTVKVFSNCAGRAKKSGHQLAKRTRD
jgi:hypothetical protein